MIRTLIVATTLAILAAISTPAPAQTPATAPLVQMEHISVEVVGKGPDVILIPGLSSPRAVWSRFVPELAKKHRVHLVQVNGFGGDDPRANLKPGVIDGIIGDIRSYVATSKLKAPAVVGHSMGGLAGMMLAARHPDSVGRLMVVDAMPFIGTIFGAPDVATIQPRAAQMRDMIAGSYGKTPAVPVTKDPGGNLSITPEGRIQVTNWSLGADVRVVALAMYEDMITDMRPEIGKITAPWTVLYASGMGEAMAKGMWEPQFAGSSAKMVAVPGAYHFIFLDQPDAFAAELAKFLGE